MISRFDFHVKNHNKHKNLFNFENSERLVKTIADVMVSGGFREAGYEYVIIDDCWLEKDRHPITHELIPDRKRFPNGIKDLADYVSTTNLYI